jgi:hypothetical protein
MEQRTPAPDERPARESIQVKGGQIIDRIRDLLEQGNVRRIVVKHEDREIVEFPLTVGVVGTVLAPQLAAIGALAARGAVLAHKDDSRR